MDEPVRMVAKGRQQVAVALGADMVPERRAGDRAEVALPGEPASAREARRFLAGALARWQMSGLADTAGLVLSELLSSAILHPRTPLVVRVRRLSGGLRLEVIDSSFGEPRHRHHTEAATTGRGLDVVEALSRRWGTEAREEGKLVWAELGPGTEI